MATFQHRLEGQDMSVGRNDPCPCGSGKKYKKCCSKKDQVDKRLSEQRRQVSKVLEPDDSIYKVWVEWRAGRRLADFNFLYDLVLDDTPLKRRLGSRGEFVAACSDGRAEIPTGDGAEFRHLQVVDHKKGRLLQTIGQKDPAVSRVRCECLDFEHTEQGWRLTDFAHVTAAKADEPTIDLALFEADAESDQDRS